MSTGYATGEIMAGELLLIVLRTVDKHRWLVEVHIEAED
jgi:hypothetical protein